MDAGEFHSVVISSIDEQYVRVTNGKVKHKIWSATAEQIASILHDPRSYIVVYNDHQPGGDETPYCKSLRFSLTRTIKYVAVITPCDQKLVGTVKVTRRLYSFHNEVGRQCRSRVYTMKYFGGMILPIPEGDRLISYGHAFYDGIRLLFDHDPLRPQFEDADADVDADKNRE